jgi:hypothetical protein
MPDWKDLAVVLCMVLVLLGAGALTVAAQTFVIVEGKVLEKGIAHLDSEDGNSYSLQTISMLIENDDRVFRIESGTVVKYAISDRDAQFVTVGSHVKLFVSSHSRVARVIDSDGTNHL